MHVSQPDVVVVFFKKINMFQSYLGILLHLNQISVHIAGRRDIRGKMGRLFYLHPQRHISGFPPYIVDENPAEIPAERQTDRESCGCVAWTPSGSPVFQGWVRQLVPPERCCGRVVPPRPDSRL